MKPITACEDWIEKISAEIDGELSLPECKRLADHLAVCEGCRLTRQAFVQDRARFVAAFDTVTQGVDLTPSVLNRLPRSQPRPGLWGPRGGRFAWRPAWFWAGAGLMGMLLGVILGRAWTLEKRTAEEPLRMASARIATDAQARRAEAPSASPTLAPEAAPPEEEIARAPAAKDRREKIMMGAGGMMGGPGHVGKGTAVTGAAPVSPIPTPSSPPSGEARLHLQVASPQAALIRAERLVADYQGTIIRSAFPAAEALQPNVAAQLTCRVSREQLAPLLEDLQRLGRVISRQVATRIPPEQPRPSGSIKLKTLPPSQEAVSPVTAAPSLSTATLTILFSESEP